VRASRSGVGGQGLGATGRESGVGGKGLEHVFLLEKSILKNKQYREVAGRGGEQYWWYAGWFSMPADAEDGV